MSDEIVMGKSGEAGLGSAGNSFLEGGAGGGPEVALEELVVELTPKQQMVMRAILSSGNVAEAARSAGVGRTTFYRWINEDERFEAAFNAWKREVMRLSRAQAIALAQPCVDAVRAAIDKGDARMAFKVGKSMGVFGPPRVGPDEPGEVVKRKARKAKEKQVKIARKERELCEEIGEEIEAAATIYEIDELIEQLILKRMKALRTESPQAKAARETNQRVLRKGDERLERIGMAVREVCEGARHGGT
jgi:AcrR family transcriptional regulator